MSEETNNTPSEGQKTVVAFVVGLLVGGLLVWIFNGDNKVEAPSDTDNEAAVINSDDDSEADDTMAPASDSSATDTMTVSDNGDGDIKVADQAAGAVVTLGDITFPAAEGWVGVRDYQNGQLTGLLGVARWSQEQGLIPSEVELLRPTTAGAEYAVVFYSESGDREFSLADDVQLEGEIAVFTAK